FVTTRPPLFMSTGRRHTITHFRKTEAKYFCVEGLTGESILHRVANVGFFRGILVVPEPIRGLRQRKSTQLTGARGESSFRIRGRLAALAGRGRVSLMYGFAPGASIRPASGGSAFRTHCQCSLLLWVVTTEEEAVHKPESFPIDKIYV